MKNYSKHKTIIVVVLIFILALLLRLYGLNWDQGQHLHPDERFLTMVATDIKLPNSFFQYLNTNASPFNPYNYSQYRFFVYGTFPIFLTKTFAVLLHLDSYDKITLLGRFLSALFDASNVVFLYFLSAKLINKKSKFIFLPSLLYAFCVLPLQLSHFFTVDTFLSTFLLATFVLLVYDFLPLAAIIFGLALACKISALYFVPIIVLFLLQKFLLTKKILPTLVLIIYCLLLTFLSFRFFQPYAFDGLFKINPFFVESIKTLQIYSRPEGNYPPGVQWLGVSSLPFSLKNIALWGLGLPVSSALIFLLITNFKTLLKNKIIIFSAIWALFLLLFQGSQPTPTMRYFLPIYPFLLVLFVFLLYHSSKKNAFYCLIVVHLLYGFSFLNIYSHNYTRVDASLWIYKNIPTGSTITNEYWDDSLPLNISPDNIGLYDSIVLHAYDSDSIEKINILYSQIFSADYIIMSSNRLWRSISSAPDLYPLTSKYYQNLFAEKINYKKILEMNSYPGFSLPFLNQCYYFGPTDFPGLKTNWFYRDLNCLYPGIYLRDDTAEEAFTVFDHPKVLIFQKQK